MIPPPASVGAERKCCEKYLVSVPDHPEANGVYTQTNHFGDVNWYQHNRKTAKFKLGPEAVWVWASPVPGKYVSYWGIRKMTGMAEIMARAWDHLYSEVCAEEASGWIAKRGMGAFTPTVTCFEETTQARVQNYIPNYIRRFSPF